MPNWLIILSDLVTESCGSDIAARKIDTAPLILVL